MVIFTQLKVYNIFFSLSRTLNNYWTKIQGLKKTEAQAFTLPWFHSKLTTLFKGLHTPYIISIWFHSFQVLASVTLLLGLGAIKFFCFPKAIWPCPCQFLFWVMNIQWHFYVNYPNLPITKITHMTKSLCGCWWKHEASNNRSKSAQDWTTWNTVYLASLWGLFENHH